MNDEPLIHREPLEDAIEMADGRRLEFNRETAVVVEHHEDYSEFDHLFISQMGAIGIRLFGIKASPIYEYLIERDYNQLYMHYPSDATILVWINMQTSQMEEELEGDVGGELDG